ncbi:GtrA family protein [Consotaella aegiceratis]|uniref:GtrA family protein n=1 Tax=Consotaella aegiceratis TaxID=3097961 RepID=UPI002F3E1FC0
MLSDGAGHVSDLRLSALEGPQGSARNIAEFLRYGFSSAAALALDYGLLIGLTEWAHLPVGVSAAIGFSAGLALVYAMSVGFVFSARRLRNPWMEFVAFAAIGLAGLVITEVLLLALTDFLAVPYTLAKIPTAVVVFLCNFAARRALLFSPPAR